MQDDGRRGGSRASTASGLLVGRARVDDERLAELARERGLRAKELGLARRAARSRGSGRARSRRPRPPSGGARSSRERGEPRPADAGLVGMDAERGEDSLLRSASSSVAPAGLEPGADRRSRATTPAARARASAAPRVVERVEVRVRVDHAAAAADSTRGKSGCAGSIPSAGDGPPVADALPGELARAGRARPGSAAPISGQVRRERDRDGAQPVGEVVERRGRARPPGVVLRELPRRRSSTWRLSARTISQMRSSAPERSQSSSRAATLGAERAELGSQRRVPTR